MAKNPLSIGLRLSVLALVALAVVGCGSSSNSSSATTAATSGGTVGGGKLA